MPLVVIAALLGLVSAQDAFALTPMPLFETVWSWHSTDAAGGSRTSVSAPERYTVQLLADGTARVRADCNRGAGSYRSNDVELRFEGIAMTKRGCPPGSRDGEFLAALARVERYRFEGIDLVAVAGGDTLRFRPLTP